MAAVVNGNTAYLTAAADYLQDKDLQVNGLIFTPNAAGDSLTLSDLSATSVAEGSNKLKVKAATNETIYLDLSSNPIRFPNGIYVSAITASAVCTLIFSRRS